MDRDHFPPHPDIVDGLSSLLQDILKLKGASPSSTYRHAATPSVAPADLVAELGGPERVREVRDSFELFDKDGDGTISNRELGPLLRSLGHNPDQEEIVEMIEEVDVDGSGSIDFLEFLHLLVKRQKETFTKEDIREIFKVFDKDGNGYVSASELKHVMGKLGVNFSDQELQEMVAEADVDGDGQVNFTEFYNVMTSQ